MDGVPVTVACRVLKLAGQPCCRRRHERPRRLRDGSRSGRADRAVRRLARQLPAAVEPCQAARPHHHRGCAPHAACGTGGGRPRGDRAARCAADADGGHGRRTRGTRLRPARAAHPPGGRRLRPGRRRLRYARRPSPAVRARRAAHPLRNLPGHQWRPAHRAALPGLRRRPDARHRGPGVTATRPTPAGGPRRSARCCSRHRRHTPFREGP